MKHKLFALRHTQAPTPGKRQEHHRVFQTLAAVYGDDPHPIVVAFKTHQRRFIAHRRIVANRRKPLQLDPHAAAPLPLGMDQFGQLKQVGQAPLTIVKSQQPWIQVFRGGQFAEHAHETMIPPKTLVPVKTHHALFPVPLGCGQFVQPIPVTAHQVGQQGCPHQRLPGRLNDGNEQPFEFFGLVGLVELYWDCRTLGMPAPNSASSMVVASAWGRTRTAISPGSTGAPSI